MSRQAPGHLTGDGHAWARASERYRTDRRPALWRSSRQPRSCVAACVLPPKPRRLQRADSRAPAYAARALPSAVAAGGRKAAAMMHAELSPSRANAKAQIIGSGRLVPTTVRKSPQTRSRSTGDAGWSPVENPIAPASCALLLIGRSGNRPTYSCMPKISRASWRSEKIRTHLMRSPAKS
jgi:hypothetical protein